MKYVINSDNGIGSLFEPDKTVRLKVFTMVLDKGNMKMDKETEEWFAKGDKNLCKHMELKDKCEDCKEEKKCK